MTTAITTDVLVVGAGLAGLTAARTLEAAGRRTRVIEKGRSVGGRLATARIGGGRLDHGAQFFTVRGDDFAATVAEAAEAGAITEWARGFVEPPDGYPRYCGAEGMSGLAEWLAGRTSSPIDTGVRIDAVGIRDGLVEFCIDGQPRYRAPAAVLTAPVPQTLGLLDAGGAVLPRGVRSDLEGIRYFSTLALLAALDAAPAVAGPGGEQHDTGPFTFVADNQRKGISAIPALTAHANHDYSMRRYHDDRDEVLAELIGLARPWLDGAGIIEAQLVKWRYAGPIEPHADRAVVADVRGARLIFAGDAFGGPKVEGAFNSGRAAGRMAL